MKSASAEAQLAGFLAKYSPEIALLAEEILAKMRARLPGAVQFVYENYNALVIAFGPNERASDAIFSIAVYPRWVNLFFAEGARLADPEKVLRGTGKQFRNVMLNNAADLDSKAVQDLMAAALKAADPPIDKSQPGRLLIKSISVKQRPRRHIS